MTRVPYPRLKLEALPRTPPQSSTTPDTGPRCFCYRGNICSQGHAMPGENAKNERLPSGSACASCRKRKKRCDGGRPEWSACQRRGTPCHYPSVLANLSIEE